MIKVNNQDILDAKVDVIVNAANGQLAHAGGIAGAIAMAAGPALQSFCDKRIKE